MPSWAHPLLPRFSFSLLLVVIITVDCCVCVCVCCQCVRRGREDDRLLHPRPCVSSVCDPVMHTQPSKPASTGRTTDFQSLAPKGVEFSIHAFCQKCVVHCLHGFPSQSINPTMRESDHRGGPPSLGYSTVIFVLTHSELFLFGNG